MTVVYLSNFFNHHQSPISDAFYKALSGNYYFVETMTIPDEQRAVGYNNIDRPYVLNYNQHKTLVDKLIIEADVVIHGEAPLCMIKSRLKQGKLTFHDNERRYKSWIKYLKWPIYTYNSLFLNKGYLLCASAYAARDFRLSGMSPKKCFKWGYFTKVDDLPLKNLRETSICENDIVRIMWCGRFLRWKHPELAVKVASKLKEDKTTFVMNMFGVGEELEPTKMLAQNMGVEDVVNFCGSLPNPDILNEMRKHDIVLLTSDQNEGWGAVINEAMASGCAVVVSHAMGAAPYLINDNVNGLIFKSKDLESLYQKTKYLINNPLRRKEIGVKAYETMSTTWRAETACRNLLQLCQSIKSGNPNPIISGPCSPAPIMNHK